MSLNRAAWSALLINTVVGWVAHAVWDASFLVGLLASMGAMIFTMVVMLLAAAEGRER